MDNERQGDMQPPAAAPWVATAPAGVRFVPTKRELVSLYLTNKFLNFPVPPNTIRELNIYEYHPNELPRLAYNTRSDQVLYLFTPLKRLGSGNVNFDRRARNGSWAMVHTYRGLYKTSSFENGVIRRHLKFSGDEGFRCNMRMKEYVMDAPRANAADPVLALCIIHPPRAVYLPAFKVPEVAPAVDEAVPEARNVQPVREENEQPVAAIFPN